MSWNQLTPEQRATVLRVLTAKELAAYKLHLAGFGYTTIARALHIRRETARDRIRRAHEKLDQETAA